MTSKRPAPAPDAAPPLRQSIAVVLVLGGAAALTAWLVATRERPVTVLPERHVPTVEVVVVAPGAVPVEVECTGRLEPLARLELSSQLAARVAALGPDFQAGGRVPAGALLFELERADFELAVARSEAALAEARAALALEEAQAESAVREWELVGEGEPSALVRREPQLARARAAVRSAEVALDRARLDLERTRVVAPFDAAVVRRAVELGQFVSPGQSLGTLVGTRAWEVRLEVPASDRPFLEPLDPERPLAAELDLGGRGGARVSARVARVSPELDPRTRTLTVYARLEGEPGELDHLRAGEFVEARLLGRPVAGGVVLPRSALRGSDAVLVVDAEGRLERRDVHVVRRDSAAVLVTEGLVAGERVVTTPLAVAADGMPVRVLGDATSSDGEPTAATEVGP